MSLSVSRNKLMKSMQVLNQRWDGVRRDWDDRVRREFEARYIEPVEGATRSTVSSIEHLQQVLARARSDCE